MRIANEIIEDGREVIENSKEIIEERKELIEELFEKAEGYVKTNIELAKLKAADKLAEIVSSLVPQAAIVILAFFFFLLINFGIAFWLGNSLGATHLGFMIVSGFYLLLTIIVLIFKNEMIKSPISNSIISKILK